MGRGMGEGGHSLQSARGSAATLSLRAGQDVIPHRRRHKLRFPIDPSGGEEGWWWGGVTGRGEGLGGAGEGEV